MGSFWQGFTVYLRAARWLRAHPFIILALLVPFICGLLAFGTAFVFLVRYGDKYLTAQLMHYFTAWPEGWAMLTYWILKVLLAISMLVLGLLLALIVVSLIASPLYEWISLRVENDLIATPAPSLSFKQMLKVLLGEFQKALVIFTLPVVLFFIPGANLVAGLVAAFLLGWNFYDYPLARRGWTFGARLRFAAREFWTIVGFGFWLAVPLVHIVLMPVAVIGGTMLNIEALARKGQVQLKQQQ